MEITKIYTAESSHRVPGATTTRCAGLHGHSYKFEITLEGTPLNNACMVLDFSVLKDAIKPFVDSFDHTHMFCKYDEEEYVEFMQKSCNRWISAPFNWSCEMMALLICRVCQEILNHTEFSNGEYCEVSSVTVWETATGRCKVTANDVRIFFQEIWMDKIEYSDGVIQDWPQILQEILLNPADSRMKYKTRRVDSFMLMPGINE